MKKYITITITLVILIVLGILIGYKLSPTTKISLKAEERINEGDTVSVIVCLDSKEDVYGIEFDLMFDEEMLEYKDSSIETSNKWCSRCEYIRKGVVRIILYDASDFNTPIRKEDLYELIFDVNNYRDGISTVLSVDNLKVYDKNGSNIRSIKSKSVEIKLK